MSNETVLVVDEEQDILQLLKEGLSKAGYRVLTSGDGAAVRQIARDERPDVIILDYNISSASSLDVCKQLKGDNSIRHIPIIFLCAKPTVEEHIAVFALGAHDLIAKPFDFDEFQARLGAAISMKLSFDRLRQKNSKLEALAKHVRAAVQHYEQPQTVPGAGADVDESAAEEGQTIVRLTRRETEILQLLARGLSNEVISKQLYISPTTTRNHIQNILGKLGVHSKLEAVAYAVRAGYVDFIG
jgi:DNA-binding NarL/FixJ family response regulator